MPKLIIDDREIEVAPQTMVIEAAAQLGIMIPRFCYHPALGSVGACRVCAVKFLEGPLKGIQMSCMVEAQDGMVVSTTDKDAVDFRKSVIEWLMLNHPHDCPVCDEGGHCLLQDMTVSGGHGIRRYAGPKRTYNDQYLGPLIQHEMNRCIHCYRCSRFYQEFAGYHDLGVMCSANRTYFGRFEDGILESPFSGNLGDICPTGVYTDKPSRYFGRRWDYQRHPSLCINCSLGCRTVVSVKYREVKRQEARFSNEVNGYFICDRGRYGFFYTSRDSRPRQAFIKGETVSHDQAVQTALAELGKTSRNAGPSAIAAVGSVRSSLETQTMLRHLCQSMGWRKPAYFMDPTATSKVKTAIARLESDLVVSLREVEKADFILCVGADPINEAPMLALAMRQAQRNCAKIVVMDPRPVSLPLDFQHLSAAPQDLCGLVGYFIKATVDPGTAASYGENAAEFFEALPDGNPKTGYPEDLLTAATDGLKTSQRPVIVCGTDILSVQGLGIAADLALFLRAADKNAGLFYLLPGGNAFGAGLLSDDKASLLNIIEAIENGEVKALILVESDPFFHFPDRNRLERALNALDLLIAVDSLNPAAQQKMHIFIPSTTLYEADGIFVNQEGRAQVVRQAHSGGVPIVQSGGGDHPPRKYGTGIPGSEPKPAWRILAELADDKTAPENKTLAEAFTRRLADIVPELADVNLTADIPEEGIRINRGVKTELRFTADFPRRHEERRGSRGNLAIILTDLTFGTDVLSAHSKCLWELEPEPTVSMHTSEAASLDLVDGDTVAIQTQNGSLEAKLKVADNMAAGVLVVPRHRRLAWQVFETGVSSIRREQIKKLEA
ncbi:MAG: NADH-quinone oxidoreductase subunit NuoG [Desulfobacterales bacterium]|nr:MAG: NADH-quinone oxidoreductase subunit NuoG [Desulfobacterales bacterium]